jgi:hypothetical protein
LQIWLLPKFDGILFFFSALGPIQGHKVQQHLTWGRLKRFFFSVSALTPNVKPALGADFKLLHQ